MDEQRWRNPDWLAGVHEWIDAHVARTGEIEQIHVRPWATVLRVPTAAGQVFFKAGADQVRHEAAVVARIAARHPDVVAPLLAADPAKGWMLMADGGEPLRTVAARERSLDRWLEVLPAYAKVQLDLAPEVDALLAAGVPDRRLKTLPGAYADLMDRIDAGPRLRDAAPRVADLCAELARAGVPETIQHDDLHDGQVHVRDGRHLILDWGDACVTHPFLTLSVTLEGVIAWGLDDVAGSVGTDPFRDAYLAPFGPGLEDATAIALRLGWACRAINGHVEGDDAPTLTRLRMFLDGRP